MFLKTLRMLNSIKRRGRAIRPESRPLRFVRHSLLALSMGACSSALPSIDGAPATPPAPSAPWRVPSGAVPAEPAPPASIAHMADTARLGGQLSLDRIVDIALRNNPQTQLSWAQARAGAATYAAATTAYFPTADGAVTVARSHTTSQTGLSDRETLSPTITLSYLLFDFGGRSGTIEAAKASAIALDLTHNATLQNVALQAEGAYFTFEANRSLLEAARLTVAEADSNLASARQRNVAGVATIADVLQAQTVLAQAQLDLETAEGNAATARGNLAIAMGLPANAQFQLLPANDSLSVSLTKVSVDTLINQALALRPDLAAVRVQIEQAQAQVRVARSSALPSLTLSSNVGKTFSDVSNFVGANYGVSIGLAVPIFNLARPYGLAAADAQVDAAVARASLMRIQVGQQVYTSYYALQTATQRVTTTDVLLASAIGSEQVARARYRAGVGTIIDLLTAQTALANARAQHAQSRWIWAISLAQLNHDVGVLGPRGQASSALVGGDSTGVRR